MTSALVVPQHRAPNTVSGSHRGSSELGDRRTAIDKAGKATPTNRLIKVIAPAKAVLSEGKKP